MKFRIARHTNDLKKIISFYTELIGLDILGSFEDHDGYDGIFIGSKNSDWHLEFTISKEAAQHSSDEDDLLVFYTSNETEYQNINTRFIENGYPNRQAKNPYWNENGSYYLDPDGFGIIIVKSKKAT